MSESASSKVTTKKESGSKFTDLLGKIVRANVITYIDATNNAAKFKADSPNEIRPLALLYGPAADKTTKFKEVGLAPPSVRSTIQEIVHRVIDEISEFPDDSELVSEDSNSFLFLVNSFNLTFPENLQLEAKYKNINDNDLLAAIQARNDFMRQKANLSLSLTKIITAFLQTLAYRMFELSSTENKPTAFDVYKFETAIAVMTTAVTLQLNGDYLPSVKTIFAILPTFDAKANKDGVAIESDIAKDPEVVALLAKKKEEKLAKESAASAAVAAAAQANSAAANKSLLTSLAATTKK